MLRQFHSPWFARNDIWCCANIWLTPGVSKGKGPHLLRRAGLRAARGEITSGIHNRLNCYVIFIVCA
jgi:hypothetical protein